MDLKLLAAGLCDEADDFLEGVTRRDEARAGIAELLTIRQAQLSPADRERVIEQAMRMLEQESFFERDAGTEE
jgi:hypothetical protein